MSNKVIKCLLSTCAGMGLLFILIDICSLSTSCIPAQKNEKIANFTIGKNIFSLKLSSM